MVLIKSDIYPTLFSENCLVISKILKFLNVTYPELTDYTHYRISSSWLQLILSCCDLKQCNDIPASIPEAGTNNNFYLVSLT